MSPKHTEPSYENPREDSKTHVPVRARAPYNFVRLPEKVVTVELPPDQDIYSDYTGYIDCEMETLSPTYIRGLITPEILKKQAELDKAEEDRARAGRRLTPEQKQERDAQESQLKLLQAPFFALNGKALIPGSSLRGMIRSIVEIVSYSKIRWVGAEPTFSFRAVAAQADDPLKEPYKEIVGSNGKYVCAGYLVQHGDHWAIRPSKLPSELGLLERGGYLKVKEKVLQSANLPDYRSFNASDYRPGYYEVSFDVELRRDRKGKSFTAVTRLGPRGAGYGHNGVLVCSGNMLETSKPGQKSPRKNHALILEAAAAKEIPIDPQAVTDYLNSLSVFQKENLRAWNDNGEWGCLKHNAPVFYVWTGREKEIVYFGHNPNFRVPVRLPGMDHASNPLDFVPLDLRADELIDFADSIFGWVPEAGGTRKDSCAGRVFFSDAALITQSEEIWYKPEPITPHVLSGPKATTFQHYLVQDKALGHNPDDKSTLAHYGTPRTETQIRGRKRYWHKGRQPDIEANAKEREHESQLTRIMPLKAGVRFAYRIHFENLRDAELGALLWALQPRGNPGETYAHKIGMGKPLGMGAVKVEKVEVTLTDRAAKRYARLFTESDALDWDIGAEEPGQDFSTVFEQSVLSALKGMAPDAQRLADLEPVQELLAMMAWRGDDPGQTWLDWTRYMEIEYGANGQNEYKERPVLPSPSEVLQWAKVDAPGKTQPSSAVQRTERPKPEPIQPAWPPPEGEIVTGEVIDSEPGGAVYLEIVSAKNLVYERWRRENVVNTEFIAVIRPQNQRARIYRDGSKHRLVVLSSTQEPNGWLIECKLDEPE